MIERDRPLAGRHALVTGGASGIGRATAQRLAADGADVVVDYVGDAEPAEVLVAEIELTEGMPSPSRPTCPTRRRSRPDDRTFRGVAGQRGGHRGQEVLGEQLRSADGQEHAADPERQRAEHVRRWLGITVASAPVVTTSASRPTVT